ncbi:hypothetical protein MKW98_001813 [Papaver atlanticum]|uniref:Uncharacterized protein n=1 Tax=Papaver atlanticum TaxID=357466 RepID=A0AAD4SAJ4_9MAGN|nr:hypothetical protein MKW98_001813 [Papaver atlanticum]
MLSSVGEFPGALKALPADEESKISREFSGVSISAVDSMISTLRNEEGYPNGLKVLVVDEDLSLLKEIEPMLALSMLHDKTRKFDIILMAILGKDMEGFKQIQQLAMEADIPIKYFRLSTVRTLWSNVARKRKEKLQKLVEAGIIDAWDKYLISTLLYSPRGDDGSLRKLITGILKEDENYMDGKDDGHYTSLIMNRKPVIPWMTSPSELQGQFIWSVFALGGPKEADPAKVLKLLPPTPGLTRKHVDIHLKEFRFLHVDYVEEHPVSDMPFVEPEKMCDDDFWRMV